MSNRFSAGAFCKITFQAVGQGAVSEIHVKGSSWDEEIQRAVVTHTGHLGVSAKWPCVLDGKGTINGDLDLDAPPYLTPPKIYAGVQGQLQYYVSPDKFFAIPCLVTKLHHAWQVEGGSVVEYSFDIEMDANSGTYQRPQS